MGMSWEHWWHLGKGFYPKVRKFKGTLLPIPCPFPRNKDPYVFNLIFIFKSDPTLDFMGDVRAPWKMLWNLEAGAPQPFHQPQLAILTILFSAGFLFPSQILNSLFFHQAASGSFVSLGLCPVKKEKL